MENIGKPATSLAEAIRLRAAQDEGGYAVGPITLTAGGAEFALAADVAEQAARSVGPKALGTLAGLIEAPLAQFPDLTRAGTDKVLGTLGSGALERIALASFTFPDGTGPIEVRSVEDRTGDRALADLAEEIRHVSALGGDVQVHDLIGLDAAISRQMAAGRVTEAALDPLADALSGRDAAAEQASADRRAVALERECAELRRELEEMRRARKAAADRIDMLAPDPSERYGADSEQTGLLPAVARDEDARAKKAALGRIRAELEEIGMLADEDDVALSNRAWLDAEAGSERREIDGLLEPGDMARLTACLRRAVSLAGDHGTGSLTGASCEVSLPVRAGCYLSYDPAGEPRARTLKVFPSAAGTTAFDAQAFNSISCGYEHLVGRPEAGDPDLASLKKVDEAVFGAEPGDGYEEPAAWRTAFDRAQAAYNAEAGVLLTCMNTEDDPSGEAGDRFVVACVGAEPGQIARAAEAGMSVAAALDAGAVGHATMFCNLTRGGGVEGMEPDIARIGALVARDPGGWAVGGDDAVVTAAKNAVQLKKAREAVAEREAAADDESRRSVFGGFGLK